ncbi:MAG TPA: MFS transporter [Isosphaeraceae bacterium]|nr:MFS transporter [Isosphaeraceae bacterium]
MSDALAAEPARVRSRTFAALEIPDYRRFYIGQGISLIGTWLQSAAVSWIVFDMTHSARMLGIVDAASVMPGLLVGLFAGVLADRVVPRTMVLLMQVAQMLLAFLLAFLVGTGVVQIWQLALILALTRISVTFEMPSRQVFLYDLVGRSTLMNAIALNSGLFNASRILGPALAGLCLARFGRTSCFIANGASYLAAIAALLAIRPVPRPHRSESGGIAEILAGFSYLRRDHRVRTLFLLMTVFGFIGMGYAALVPAYARLVVRTGAMGYSLLLASSGVGATTGALIVASLGGLRRKEALVLGGMALFAVALAAAGYLPPAVSRAWSHRAGLFVATGCLFGVGFGAITFYSATQTLIQTTAPDHLRGRIMGIWMIVYSGSVPPGSLWAGELAARHGVPLVMEISAAICLLVAAGMLVSGALIDRGHAHELHRPAVSPEAAAKTASH